jgi:hypothetical protein
LIVSPLADGYTWCLRFAFSYDVGHLGSETTIEVPRGFATDFASIPRPFWLIWPRWGRYGSAAVIHDWLYWEQIMPRATADHILREGMSVVGVDKFTRNAIYYAVRIFGSFAWRKNQRDRESGFNRVMDEVPTKSAATHERPPSKFMALFQKLYEAQND